MKKSIKKVISYKPLLALLILVAGGAVFVQFEKNTTQFNDASKGLLVIGWYASLYLVICFGFCHLLAKLIFWKLRFESSQTKRILTAVTALLLMVGPALIIRFLVATDQKGEFSELVPYYQFTETTVMLIEKLLAASVS